MDPVERNRHREAPMTADAKNQPSEDQPLAEAETIARLAGTGDDVDTAGEDADLPDDQPRAEAETAALARGAIATEGRPEFPQRQETGLLPGEAIGSGARPTGPYVFLPGDGQAEAQEKVIAEFSAEQAKAHEANAEAAEDDKPKPKKAAAKKAAPKKEQS